jgi:hypothetical protein
MILFTQINLLFNMPVEIFKIEEQLARLPAKIRDQKLVVIEKEKELETAKLEYNVKYGMALVGATRNNATEKKSDAVIQSALYAEKVIECQYNLKKEEAGLNYLTDKFISARKIGSLEQEIMRSQLQGN